MNLNIKKYVPFILVLVAIVILSGTSYALLKSTSKGSNPYVMNVGVLEISFQDSEEDKLTLVNQIPISDEEGIDSEEEYTFTIKNTGTLPATYSVYIEETSTNPEFKNVIRYITSKNDAEYGEPKTLSDNKYIDTNATLGIDQTATYKVKLWLSIDADNTYMNKTFTARIVMDTTLNYGGFATDTEKLVEDNIVDYATASASNFSGGLVAINNNGTLYNENDNTQTIREYRYSGPSVNNYVFFDTDGDSVKDENEIWRIVGVFKNSSDEWNIKLMRNTMLTSEELPQTYTYGGTTYQIDANNNGSAGWNTTVTATNYNYWTTAGLQYYLNGSNGYFGTLSINSQVLIDKNYTYYLGAFYYETATTISAYTDERNTSKILSGNKSTWNKATYSNANGIALLYPSDYGYSATSNYWGSPLLSNWSSTQTNTSWMFKTANHIQEWLLSPSSYAHDMGGICVASLSSDGLIAYDNGALGFIPARPTLNLLSTAPIDTNHQGNETDPYVLLLN